MKNLPFLVDLQQDYTDHLSHLSLKTVLMFTRKITVALPVSSPGLRQDVTGPRNNRDRRKYKAAVKDSVYSLWDGRTKCICRKLKQ